ncbi:MAG: hypothetical protein JO255_03385 [Alphaproteobacteria bacterium]|nr:hypothetical protein [Alphaproteobacteria bacterium]
MAGSVIAFVGENANGILEWWTREILKRIERAGFTTYLIDLLKPGWTDTLSEALKSNPTFAFSFQGIGHAVKMHDDLLWNKLKLPFFSYMGDAPYLAPHLHFQPSKKCYLLYGCRDFFDAYQKYLKGPSVALLQPYGFPENPHALETRWKDREIDIVYVKTGVDPRQIEASWEKLPKSIRALIADAAAVVLSGSDDTIADICAACFAAADISWGDRKEVFCAVAANVDLYVRARRAERMVRFLMTQPARILGPGWDFIDKSGARASFHPSLPAGELFPLYAKAKVVASTTPSVRHGMHERVMAGMHSRSAVFSDLTPFARSLAPDYPAYLGADIDSPHFEEQAAQCLFFPADIEERIEHSYRGARKNLSLDAILGAFLRALELDGFVSNAAAWFVFG